jgi:hypothetical protein
VVVVVQVVRVGVGVEQVQVHQLRHQTKVSALFVQWAGQAVDCAVCHDVHVVREVVVGAVHA